MVIAERLIWSIDWGRYELMEGTAEGFGHDLTAFVTDAPVVERHALWARMENRVFAQDDIFTAAEPTLAVVFAALADGVEESTAVSVLDLVFHIVHAAHYRDDGLGRRCLGKAQEAGWLLVHIGSRGSRNVRDACLEVLDLVSPSCAAALRLSV